VGHAEPGIEAPESIFACLDNKKLPVIGDWRCHWHEGSVLGDCVGERDVLGILGARTSSAISTHLLRFYSLSVEIANITPASAYWGVLHWSWVPGPRRCSAFGFEETLRRQSQINRWEAIRRKRLTRRWWGSRRLELLDDQQLFKAQRFRRILHGFIFKEEKDFRPVKIRESSVVWPSIDMLLITSLIP
jgi:hypothetical protein